MLGRSVEQKWKPEIIEQSNLTVQQVLQILVSLEIKDYIINSGATDYALIKF